MSDDFSSSVLERIVAQICQTLGYTSTQITALEVLTSVLIEYIMRLSKGAHRYAELTGRTEPVLRDFDLVFRELGIDIGALKAYIDNIGEVLPPLKVPKYPVKKENHLNFLRPGSNEVVLRNLHIYDYLPPQFPDMENSSIVPVKEEDVSDTQYTRNSLPTDTASACTLSPPILSKNTSDDESLCTSKEAECVSGQPLREISILMTRSGFLSSSFEGKLPEVKLSKDRSVTNKDRSVPSKDSTVTNKEAHDSKSTTISLKTLLASKELLKKHKKHAKLSSGERKRSSLHKVKRSGTSIESENKVSRDQTTRQKVMQNFEAITSGSQIIDRRLKHLVHFKPKLKCAKVTSSENLVRKDRVIVPGSSKGFKIPKKRSESNFSILNESTSKRHSVSEDDGQRFEYKRTQ